MSLIAYADGIHAAGISPVDVVARTGGTDPEVFLGWTPEALPWLAWDGLTGSTSMAGYSLAVPVRAGRLRYVPVRLSAVPPLLARLRPDVAVVPGRHRGSELVFRGTVGWGPAAARAAAAVVVEVDDSAPDLGEPPIPGRIVAAVEREVRVVGTGAVASVRGSRPRRRPQRRVDPARRTDAPARTGRDRGGNRHERRPPGRYLVGTAHRRHGRPRAPWAAARDGDRGLHVGLGTDRTAGARGPARARADRGDPRHRRGLAHPALRRLQHRAPGRARRRGQRRAGR